jgi:predicted dehydrogenase
VNNRYSRRNFLGRGVPGFALNPLAPQRAGKPIRVGFVGIGDRGSDHLQILLGMDSVEVPALCDTDANHLYRAKRRVEQSGKPSPAIYNGPSDYLRLCERTDLDLVVTATPWHLHAPVCIAAMRNGKHATTEVPAALTVDECWELVETSEKSGKHCMMLEEENYDPQVLQVLEMAQRGVFGEVLFSSGGYVHDLRLVKFDPEREPWRLQHSVDRNGNLYPTHPMGPMAWWMNINRGDRFDYLVSMSTKAICLNEYAAHYFGGRHPYAGMTMNQGDGNTTLLRTMDGKMAVLYFDTNSPHPHTTDLRLQGTKGHYSANIRKVYIEGRSPHEHQWEPIENYNTEFGHSLYKNLDASRLQEANGEGPTTDVMWARFMKALMTGTQPDMTVYDAVTWSVISALSERSVAGESHPVDFPDFTRGKWKTTAAVKLE